MRLSLLARRFLYLNDPAVGRQRLCFCWFFMPCVSLPSVGQLISLKMDVEILE
jgi:hypothetical protein